MRWEGAACGAAPACPAAAVNSPGEGKLAEEEEDHEAEFLGVSWRCPASKGGRIRERNWSYRREENRGEEEKRREKFRLEKI